MNPLILKDALTNIDALAETLSWKPFRPGVDIHRLYGDGKEGPSAAFLRYAPGASVPYHTHGGYEHIFILKGSQVDRTGRNGAGTVIINPPGSEHHVVSPDGCVVLVIWEKPVVVVEGTQRPAVSSDCR
jgi:anti-sigma factor ChrR (cupin superfamily)